MHTAYFLRSRDWGHWFDKAFVHQMKEHIQTCRSELSITRFRIEERISRGCPRPWAPQLAWLIQKSFQKEVSAQMAARSKYDAEDRVRSHLRRFGLLDRRQAALALKRLLRLGGDVPPRVWAATHGCLWNRWATARRRQVTRSNCLLGCSWAEDSIEHYAQCPAIVDFAQRRLQITFRFSPPIHYWMLAAPEDQESRVDGWWSRLALLLFAVLRTTNLARIHGRLQGEQVDRALWQAAIEGAKGTSLLPWSSA